MVQVSYPGVYIVEKSSGVHTITGVATSIAAFVGYTRKGAVDKAALVTSFADFERSHGGLDVDSPLSYAVRQFFLNGGTQAYIVRVASGHQTAAWVLQNDVPAPVLDIAAIDAGTWGNELRVTVELTGVRNPRNDFNLVILRQAPGAPAPTRVETHRNLTLDPRSALYVQTVVNSASALVRATVRLPLTFGDAGFTLSKDLNGVTLTVPANGTISGTVDGTTPFILSVSHGAAVWPSLDDLVTDINTAITAGLYGGDLVATRADIDGLDDAAGDFVKLASLHPGASSNVLVNAGAPGTLAAFLGLGLANGGAEQSGAVEHRPTAVTAIAPSTLGLDGLPGTETQLAGNAAAKTGIQALLDVDLFNILSIPETFGMPATGGGAVVIPAAVALCEMKRAFYIIDAPSACTLDNVDDWATSVTTSRNAATYFPPVRIVDPLAGQTPREFAPSGTLAGIYARTDATRGVWKAPAGTEASLNGVLDLARPLNDIENGIINPLGINALRSFPAYGRVAWGARTLRGSDAMADEYKYIPIRRLALFLEESLYRGTQWVVFEPNDEPLWSQIRLNVGVFLNGLFRQGAFQGMSPKEAYFVKCDKETTTQADRNLGIVNILVGFAPLKPAEFVVLTIQQIAGDLH